MEVETPPPAPVSALLSLPLELREQIYQYLLTPLTQDLTIRSLFIRTYYRNVFMTQQPKGLCTSLLRVCRQIHQEAQSLLYALPLWCCGCRCENLASQIGLVNFGFIKRMQIDADDLKLVVLSLMQDHNAQQHINKPLAAPSNSAGINEKSTRGLAGLDRPPRARFTNLEILLVEGYQATAITSLGDRRAREEALTLCTLAQCILDRHPLLSVLVQRDKFGNGGSDAIDTTMGRVRWRFLRDSRDKTEGEHVVDMNEMVQLLQEMLDYDEKEGVRRRSSLPTEWTGTGVFEQYPYLPRQRIVF